MAFKSTNFWSMVKDTIFIGIDPGKKGFVTIMAPDEALDFFPVPVIGSVIDVNTLTKSFECLTATAKNKGYDIVAGIEQVHAIYGSSAKATFEFGYCVGLLEALLVANHISYTKIQPKAWQKEMFEGIAKIKKVGKTSTDTKKMSILASRRLFPDIDLRKTLRCKNDDDNKSDSLLICEHMRRKYNK